MTRYKVIADYPNDIGHKVGNIITILPILSEAERAKTIAYFEKYPHLFKLMEWWEDVPVEDMPRYITSKADSSIIYEVDDWIAELSQEGVYDVLALYEPSTKQEYEAYLKLKK